MPRMDWSVAWRQLVYRQRRTVQLKRLLAHRAVHREHGHSMIIAPLCSASKVACSGGARRRAASSAVITPVAETSGTVRIRRRSVTYLSGSDLGAEEEHVGGDEEDHDEGDEYRDLGACDEDALGESELSGDRSLELLGKEDVE